MTNIAKDKTNFRDVGFVRGFVEISVERVEQRGFAGFDGGLQPAELVLPVGQRARGAGLEILALPGNRCGQVHIPFGEVSAPAYKFVKP